MPERYSRHMKILTKLKQIRQVQVSRSIGNSYVIDVYTASQSTTRIPTTIKHVNSDSKGRQVTALFSRPEVHVAKQFADFVKLRDELYEACHTGPHLYMNCRFCSEVTRYLLFGARFIESLLQLAVACPVIDLEACPCQEKLPRQLYNFLLSC
ncbi:uncharacterized protein PITG_07541 [Phytophthora infestans T30-4]|uniref:PX domain-containing protein n=1 Tax=Phytophthora infestans (strain T30-4) TaxID=403677 RepID=D0N8L2_PHYIT|nr:uncharacterized protein PITG_07541 [Phytophthora infestans T30-4]EEY53897.1 conserved hypothetical protein [Phytophthora infestans T30-4]|eukprot:XP_002904528.1 conserved hypothetical protein [Phytophthora infestans T30-4]